MTRHLTNHVNANLPRMLRLAVEDTYNDCDSPVWFAITLYHGILRILVAVFSKGDVVKGR